MSFVPLIVAINWGTSMFQRWPNVEWLELRQEHPITQVRKFGTIVHMMQNVICGLLAVWSTKWQTLAHHSGPTI